MARPRQTAVLTAPATHCTPLTAGSSWARELPAHSIVVGTVSTAIARRSARREGHLALDLAVDHEPAVEALR